MDLLPLHKQKLLHWDHKVQEQNHNIDRKSKRSLSSYITPPSRALKYLKPHDKEIIKMQELENQKLIHKLSAISRRKNKFVSPSDQLQERLLTLNTQRRIQQRKRKEMRLQQANDIIIDRIIRARSFNSSILGVNQELSISQSRARRGSNRSMLLPAIDPEGLQMND